MQPPVEQHRLRLCLPDDPCQLLLGEAVGGAHVDAVTGRDCPDTVFRLPRVADLAHRDGVERRTEGPRDLGRGVHPAAREADDDDLAAALPGERYGEHPSRVPPIGEQRIGNGPDRKTFHPSNVRTPSADRHRGETEARDQ